MLTYIYHQGRFSKFFIISVGVVLLLSCTPKLPPADPAHAQQLRNEALKFDLRRDYASAADRYQQATLYDPHDNSTYMKLAELQEAIEQPAAAVDTYMRALKYLPATDSKREYIVYRSALLLAAKLGNPDNAESLMAKLNTPALQSDLAGVITLQQDAPDQALKQFKNALRHAMMRDQYARVFFHIAQAHDILGDEDRSRKALLIAVEKASSLALKEDIRRFFEAMISR